MGIEVTSQYNEDHICKPIVNMILKSEKLKIFPLKSGTKQGYQFLPLLLNIVLEGLVTEIRTEK